MTATRRTDKSVSSSSVELVAIPPDHADQVWGLFRPLIAPALLRCRDLNADVVLAAAREGRCQLWLAWDTSAREPLAGLATQIFDGPLRRVARVIACGGRLINQWIHLLANIEEWARAEGCSALEIQGRKGWTKVLPDDYEKTQYVFSKEL